MNRDDQPPDLQAVNESALEARIVAWVSGEASAFEAAELERLLAEKPELAIFKRRIEAVRGLVREAVHPDKEPLLLSPERRTKLLKALGATESSATAAKPAESANPSITAYRKAHRKDRRWLYAIAACLTVGLFTLMSIPAFQKVRSLRLSKPESVEAHLASPETSYLRLEMPTVSASDARAVADGVKRKEIGLEKKSKAALAERQKYGAEEARPLRFDPAATGITARPGATFDPAQTRIAPPTIDKDEDQGYTATSTLAGTRMRTDLSDIGSAITVTTDQFLRDAAASNGKSESLAYSSNAEIGGVKGDFAASVPAASPPAQAPNFFAVGAPDAKENKPAVSVEPNNETIVLSPFSISAPPSAGYIATGGKSEFKARTAEKQDVIPPGDDRPASPARKPAAPPTTQEINAAKEPVSTFSLHVSDVSFRLAQEALEDGDPIDPARIRPEEFYNAFTYGDPTPAMAEKVSCRIEQAAHPFLQQRNLVRIAVKVAAAGRNAAQPLHLTVLLDTSGSMEREDRAATVHRAMAALTSLLGPNDRLTLIGFARTPRLLAESLAGDHAHEVLDIIARTPAEGGTNLEEALKLGGELAHRQFESEAQNRIVLLTDGAANLGNADPAVLAASIETLRQQGIAFDACGVGLEGLDDAMLENLTRKGDGRYYVLNTPEAADAGFAHQLAGAFRPAAQNVKLQVRFNPARVGYYRLIGFEQHRLREEDFRNDRVDAAELAAEEAAVAVYQVEALPQGEGELGEVYVRFRDTASGSMVERSWTLAYDAQSPAFDRASPSMQLAGTAALLAEKLHGGETGNAIRLSELAPVVNKLRSHYANEPRVQELVKMFEQARKLTGD